MRLIVMSDSHRDYDALCRRKRKTQKNDTQNAKNFKKIGE